MIIINEKNHRDKKEIPVGFGMSLAMNGDAMERFAELSADEKKKLITRAKNAKTKHEMTKLTDGLTKIDE